MGYTAPVTFREKIVVVACLLALTVAYAAPIFSPLDGLVSGEALKDSDWLKIAAFERFERETILQHQKLPTWCPYFGGGYPLLAHPEDGTLSPLTWPSYVLGEVVGMKVQLVIVLFLGALGTFLVARRMLRFEVEAAAAAAVSLLVAGWMAWRVHYGWPMHFGYYLFPWALYFTWRALSDSRWLVAATAVMVVISQQVAQGLPFFFLFLLVWAAAADGAQFKRTRALRRVRLVLELGVLTALAGAIKVAGLVRLMSVNPRGVPYETYRPLDHFYTGPIDWARFIVGEADVFYKNIGLGPWLAALAAVGLVVAFRRLWPLLVPTALLMWIGAGPNAPLDLFGLLHKLPVFGSMHWPLKYTNFFVAFMLSLAVGGYVDFAVVRLGRRWRWAALALALLPALPMIWSHMALMDRSFALPLAEHDPTGPFRQVAAFEGAPRGAGRSEQAHMYRLLRRNEGTIDWDGDLLLPENATPAFRVQDSNLRVPVPDYLGEAYVVGTGSVGSLEWLGDGFRVTGTAGASSRVVLNQNFDPDWENVTSHRGLLARDVPPGDFDEVFVYRPAWLRWGAAVAGLTWLTLIGWLVSAYIKPRRPTAGGAKRA